MTPQELYNYTHEAIARAILYKRLFLVNALQSVGVNVEYGISDADLTTAVLAAIGKSPEFREKIQPALVEVMLAKHASEGATIVNGAPGAGGGLTLDSFSVQRALFATGERRHGIFGSMDDMSGGFGDQSAYNTFESTADTGGNGGETTTTSSAPAASTSTGGSSSGSLLSGVFDSSFIKGLLTTGVGVVANKINSGTQTSLAGSALAIEQEKTKQAALQAQINGGAGAPKPVMSTGVKIAIAVGSVALLGTVVYLIARKPATAR